MRRRVPGPLRARSLLLPVAVVAAGVTAAASVWLDRVATARLAARQQALDRVTEVAAERRALGAERARLARRPAAPRPGPDELELRWLEALIRWRRDHSPAALTYRIEPRHELPPAAAGGPRLDLVESRLALDADLAHEERLHSLLQALLEAGAGRALVRACELRPADAGGGLQVHCRLAAYAPTGSGETGS